MIIALAILFCIFLVGCLLLILYLQKQTKAYILIKTVYTNKFLSCEMNIEDYNNKKKELDSGINPLLKYYMKKKGVIK